MEIEALKAFPISPDGTRTFVLTAGARLNVRDELGQALVKSGLAKDASAEASTPRVGPETKDGGDVNPEEDDDNPFLDDEPEAEPKAPKAKPRARRENKDAGSRSRRS
jgi:hypothetical protein